LVFRLPRASLRAFRLTNHFGEYLAGLQRPLGRGAKKAPLMLRGVALAAAALLLLYVGFALGQHHEEHPEQRRAVRLLTVIVAVLAASLAWSYSVR
jgi:hypothetical protein